jgi:hypothetical protein
VRTRDLQPQPDQDRRTPPMTARTPRSTNQLGGRSTESRIAPPQPAHSPINSSGQSDQKS